MLFLYMRGSVRGDEVQSSQGRLRQVRRLSFDHFDGHDAQTPDVDFPAVLFAGDHFRGHPVWGADHGGSFALRFVDLRAKAKIGCDLLVLH